MKKLIVLSGSGISAESGLKTFRDAGGLWEGHKWEEVASPEGWKKNRELVLRFYNERIAQCRTVHPNAGHKALVRLEQKYDVHIITQNVDDLHERAGSTQIMHLHGELMKTRSTVDPHLVYPLTKAKIEVGDTCEKGSQLRPHIVWFGESVPLFNDARDICKGADIILIVGTSMAVYPANLLVTYAPKSCQVYLVDPKLPDMMNGMKFTFVEGTAARKLPDLVDTLLAEA